MVVLSGGDSLECSWSGFIEKESGVEFYKFGIGKVEGDDSMYEFHRVEANDNSHKATGRFDVSKGCVMFELEYCM